MRSDEDSSILRNDEAIAHSQSEKTTRRVQVKNLKSRQTVSALVTPAGFPRHRVSQCLRIPKAIIEGNGGKECTDREAAAFCGRASCERDSTGDLFGGEDGLLEHRSVGRVRPTKLAWRIVKSKPPGQKVTAMRKALLDAPVLSDLYRCLQERPLSDLPSLIESLKPSIEISSSDMHSLVVVLIRSLGDANLLEVVEGRQRVVGCQRKS